MGSGYTDTTNHKLTEGHREAEKDREKEREEGGKTAPEEEYNTGKEKRGWMEGEGKRQWGKVQNGSNSHSFTALLFSPPPADNPSDLNPFPSVTCFGLFFFSSFSCMWASFREWLRRLFHSTFDIAVPVLVHSGRICGPW